MTAFEASPALARLASTHSGLPVEVRRLQEIEWQDAFDGIWACVSLLCVPIAKLPEMLRRLARALVPAGVLYASLPNRRSGVTRAWGRRITVLDQKGHAARMKASDRLRTTDNSNNLLLNGAAKVRSIANLIRSATGLILLFFFIVYAGAFLGISLDMILAVISFFIIALIIGAIATVILGLASKQVRNEQTRKTSRARTQSNKTMPQSTGIHKTMTNSIQPTQGLIIQAEPLEKILTGRKTWEMRSAHTKKRGRIALIKKGSGKIYGTATIINSLGPFTEEDMIAHQDKHGMSLSRMREPQTFKWRCAWVLSDIKRLTVPVEYVQKSGAVTFVNLDDAAIARLTRTV